METYLLKSSIALIILYTLYRIVTMYEFNHQFNRIIGLVCVIFSITFSMVSLPVEDFNGSIEITSAVAAVSKVTHNVQEISTGTTNILLIGYLAGVCLFSLRILLGFVNLVRLYVTSLKSKRWGFTVVTIDREISPFTFFNILFIGSKKILRVERDAMILHEQIHRDQYHSVDSVLLEFFTIIFWFNPAIWFFRNDIKEQHEFFADELVLKSGISAAAYQQILFKARTGVSVELANYLSMKTSLIKRFKMMTQMKSNAKTWYWNTSLFMSMMAVIFFLGSFSGIQMEEVDQQATYEGGDYEMYRKISSQIKYPLSAREENRVGLVEVSFTVNEKGEVKDVKAKASDGAYRLQEIVVVGYAKPSGTQKEPGDVLKDESVRVVSSLGKFIPAQKDGKAVSSVLTLPIKFKLE